MEIRNICFFNHYHNGDLFHSKEYVRDIIATVPLKYYYAHRCHSNVLADVDAEYTPLPNINDKTIFAAQGDTFFINTWIGAYFNNPELGIEHDGECTIRFLHSMYEKVYVKLNEIMLGVNLTLKPVEHYFPRIDFDKWFLDNVNTFLENHDKSRRMVLFSNGPCLSGQCDAYNDKMSGLIISLAKKHNDVTFIATHKFTTDGDVPNLLFTNDIIQQVSGCDLNEIAYLSTKCDLIVGRNSGPFCFCTTQDNINDSKKTFYAFGDRETDCFFHGTPVKARFVFAKYETEGKLLSDIENLMTGEH